MGICKCKKRADLFCFVHKKPVCEQCIVNEHLTCAIKTYVDWLTDSDYEQPVCGICKGDLHPDNVVRLTCLDMFHPECLDMHASSLPPHTAKAGYLCPSCSKPLFPTDERTPLAKHVLKHLSKSAWSSSFVTGKIADPSFDADSSVSSNANPLTSTPYSKDTPPSTPSHLQSPTLSPLAPSSSPLSPTSSQQPLKRQVGVSDNNNINDSSSFGSRRGKEQLKEHAIHMLNDAEQNDEDDNDKYKKRSVTQLLVALGLMQPAKASSGRRGKGIRLDAKRILMIVALLTCLITVFVMGLSILDSDTSTSDTPAPA